MNIIRSAVNKPVTTALIFTAFAIFGIFSLMNTSVAQMPDFDANVVLVMSSYPGASATDVENNLTKLLENALNSVANLKDLTSRSKENTSVVVLQFEYGTDIDDACNDIRDKRDLINSSLPDGASVPVLFKFGMDDMPVLILSATADKNLAGLDRILDDKVVTPLGRVKGVGTVSVAGAPAREIHVYCDPSKLEAYGLTVAGISQTIALENRNVPSGSIDIGSESFALRVEKEFKDPSELLDVVVSTRNGQVVCLKDVARVEDGLEEKSQESFTNGERSAMIAIQKQSGANTVNVIRQAKKKLSEVASDLPSDIKITTVVDSSDSILNTIDSLKETIIITLLVVMLVVFLFLGRWRATFIIVLSIPIALLGSLVYLYATGNTLNIISMSALSIAIGMVVDDAIVVLENISTHLERGEKPKEAAVFGHCVDPHHAVRVPAADDGFGNGGNHIQAAWLHREHHHDHIHDGSLDPCADALLEDALHQAEDREDPQGHLRPRGEVPGQALGRIFQAHSMVRQAQEGGDLRCSRHLRPGPGVLCARPEERVLPDHG